MYQSLYRKYRPVNFSEVVGQEVIVKTLKHAIENNHINHAYLFTGPRGTGKTSIAKIFAKTINCENPLNAIPCEKCVNCTQINNKQTIDIIEIDAASNNGVDEIRELRNKASLVPTIGKYKIYIIDEVHMLTTGAFNALLKTLEEPPAHVIFILATTEPHKIPSTILSRCQRFDFKKIPKQKMINQLKKIADLEKISAKEEIYEEIARLSDGCMRDALSIFDQVIAYSEAEITLEDVHEINGSLPKEKLINFIDSIVSKNYEETFKIIDTYDNDGKNFVKLTEEMILILRDIMINITIPDYFETDEYINEILKISEKINLDTIMEFLKLTNESLLEQKKSSNPKINFEMLIISLLNDKKQNIGIKESVEEKPTSEIIKTLEKNKEELKEKAQEEKKAIKDNTKVNNYETKTKEKIQNLQNIRVNNTLCNFNKKEFIAIKQELENIRNLLLDPDYMEIVSMIIDGELKAASFDHMVFVYKNVLESIEFNVRIPKIDEILSKVFNRKIYSISIDTKEWTKIKEEFNSKQIEYTLLEEPSDIEKYLKEDNNDPNLENVFGEIIEYK